MGSIFNNETKIHSINLTPFTSKYRKDCGWHIEIIFTLKADDLYWHRATKNEEYKEILSYNQEDNTFKFNQCITSTTTTEAAIQELKEIQKGIINPNYISPVERYILHCIEVLDLYWD